MGKAMNEIKKWFISVRPFSFPASTMPVIFGAVLAVTWGGYPFRWGLFMLSLSAMVILHSAANILNDVFDYKRGIDKVPNPVSGGIVRGIISPTEAKRASILLFLLGAAIGIILVILSGIWLLAIGLLGLFVGVFYTSDHKLALKYNGLGDLAVFLNFGILGALGSWYVQTGVLSFLPVVWSIPMATLVIAILHANNWRDITSDRKGRVTTIANLLGDKGSQVYYGFLIFGPFFMILLFIFVPYIFFRQLPSMPFTFLITLLAIPLAVKLWKLAVLRQTPRKPMDFITLDGATAKLNLQFGLLCSLSLLVNLLISSLLH
jgi:1,4-dihydroxy-2-naphthoate octaprenyltransferase